MTVVVTVLGSVIVALISGAVTAWGVIEYRKLRDAQAKKELAEADSETVGQMKVIVDERNEEVDRLKDTLAVYELRQRDHEKRLAALERWASALVQQVLDLGEDPVPFVTED